MARSFIEQETTRREGLVCPRCTLAAAWEVPLVQLTPMGVNPYGVARGCQACGPVRSLGPWTPDERVRS